MPNDSTTDATAEAIAPVIATARPGRRRRPSGEPPPLPRRVVETTRWHFAALVTVVAVEVVLALHPARVLVTRAEDATVRALAALRSTPVDTVAGAVQHVGAPGVARVLGWATIAVLILTLRLRHLLAYLASVLTVVLASDVLAEWQGRPRPTGVVLAGDWSGYAHPAVPVAALAVVCAGLTRSTLPPGRWRRTGALVASIAVAVLAVSLVLLGVAHPSDVLVAIMLGWALPGVLFRLLCPDEAFPVSYRRSGNRAHVDLGGARREAVLRAFEQQLGVHATDIEPFGLGGSAGSTPLRVTIRNADGSSGVLFAKLYAVSHLRSDRWYKLSRMVLYGQLEDEKPFSTVRRLVEYEDHMLRLLGDAGLPTPRPHGLIEITPEREYVVAMEFFTGAEELTRAALGEREIDSGLSIVRQLWQIGVAHRDIKPSNLLLRDGRVLLIDVAFATVRPTPWRQAVDLANMMLTLGLCSSAESVYARARRLFAAEDIAEAFAASRSVTIPSQLRSRLREDGRDLVGRFRSLAPSRPAVPIQLWTLRRVAVSAAALGLVAAMLVGTYLYAGLAGLL